MVFNPADLEEASMALCKQAQVESFKDDYKDLAANRALSSNSSILPLQPVLVDGIIRVGGRLTQAPIPYEAKHQALLSRGHLYQSKIISLGHPRKTLPCRKGAHASTCTPTVLDPPRKVVC